MLGGVQFAHYFLGFLGEQLVEVVEFGGFVVLVLELVPEHVLRWDAPLEKLQEHHLVAGGLPLQVPGDASQLVDLVILELWDRNGLDFELVLLYFFQRDGYVLPVVLPQEVAQVDREFLGVGLGEQELVTMLVLHQPPLAPRLVQLG